MGLDFLIMIFPMIVDQFKASNQDVYQMPPPAFAERAQIKEAMPISEAIKQLGMPNGVERSTWNPSQKMVYYRGPMCAHRDSNCYLVVEDGKVVSFAHFKPQYIAGI